MFIGSYQHNLDAKGRLTMPAEFRDELGSVVYVTRGFEGCLSVYSEEDFMNIFNRLKTLKDSNKEARQYIRMFSVNTKKAEIDKMGRINLPGNLIQLAELKKSCLILGAIDRIEIWDEEKWNSFYDEHEDEYESVAESAFKDED